ncbi:hypothetical protein OCU04_000001 [Sclerotinia nivalis]|uniref:Uncharacterized protein n=1 Tax=Sclerotinia nivalis TaxID=352851 RepID=A0A9X0AV75_9HELO|nr:hypothetical protein OCU04_000001 [Sclerotinia nivalis]
MLEQIKNQSLDELEDLMNGFSRKYTVDTVDVDDNISDIQDNGSNVVDAVDTYQRSASASRGSVIAAFARKPNDEKKQETELDESGCGSDSIFIPSSSER